MTPEFKVFQEVVASYAKHDSPEENPALELSFTQLSINSLAMVNLIVDLEEALETTMPDEILTPEVFSSPNSLWKALEPHVGNARQ